MDTKKILVVEDDPFLRQIYGDTLRDEHYQVDTAVDGEDGFTKMKNGAYDLVLLDILMPKLNGFEVVEKLQVDPTYQHTCKFILYLTNLDNESDIKRALTLGNGYLIKSQITPGDLVKEVKMYMEKVDIAATPTDSPIPQAA